jgi:hypothetical protein
VRVRLAGYPELEREVVLPARHAMDVLLELLEPAAPRVALAPQGAARPGAPAPALAQGRESTAWSAPAWWTWTLLGGSSALLLGAGALELSRRGLEDEARAEPRQIDYRDKLEAMESRQTGARVLLGVGAALALLGGVSLYLDLSAGEEPSQAVAGCAPGACQLSLRSVW